MFKKGSDISKCQVCGGRLPDSVPSKIARQARKYGLSLNGHSTFQERTILVLHQELLQLLSQVLHYKTSYWYTFRGKYMTRLLTQGGIESYKAAYRTLRKWHPTLPKPEEVFIDWENTSVDDMRLLIQKLERKLGPSIPPTSTSDSTSDSTSPAETSQKLAYFLVMTVAAAGISIAYLARKNEITWVKAEIAGEKLIKAEKNATRFKTDYENVNTQLEHAKEELEALRKGKTVSETKINKLESVMKGLQTNIQSNNSELTKLRGELNVKKRTVLEQQTQLETAAHAKEVELSALRAQIESKQKELDDSNRARDLVVQAHEQLLGEIEAAQTSVKEEKQTIKNLTTQLKKIQRELGEQKNLLKNTKEEQPQPQASAAPQEKLESKIKTLSEELNKNVAALKTAGDNLTKAKEELQRLNQKVQESNQQVVSTLEELNTIKDELAGSVQKQKKLETAKESLEKQIDKAEAKFNEEKSAMKKKQQALQRENNSLKSEQKELNEQIANMTRENIQKLSKAGEKLQKQTTKVKEAEAEVSRLKQELHTAKQQFKETKAETKISLDAATKQSDKNGSALTRVNEELDRKNRQNAQQQSEITSLSARIRELETANDSGGAAQKRQSKKILDLTNRLTDISAKNEQTQTQLASFTEQKESLQQEKAALDKDIEKFNESKKQANRTYRNAVQEHDRSQKKLNEEQEALKEQAKILNEQKKTQEASLNEQKTDLNKQKKALQTQEASLNKKKQSLQDFEARIVDATQRLEAEKKLQEEGKVTLGNAEEFKRNLDAQNATFNTQKADFNTQKADFDAQKADFDAQKAAFDAQKAAFEGQKATLVHQSDSLLASKTGEIAELKKKLQDLETEKKKLATEMGSLEGASKFQLEKNKALLTQYQKENAELKAELRASLSPKNAEQAKLATGMADFDSASTRQRESGGNSVLDKIHPSKKIRVSRSQEAPQQPHEKVSAPEVKEKQVAKRNIKKKQGNPPKSKRVRIEGGIDSITVAAEEAGGDIASKTQELQNLEARIATTLSQLNIFKKNRIAEEKKLTEATAELRTHKKSITAAKLESARVNESLKKLTTQVDALTATKTEILTEFKKIEFSLLQTSSAYTRWVQALNHIAKDFPSTIAPSTPDTDKFLKYVHALKSGLNHGLTFANKSQKVSTRLIEIKADQTQIKDILKELAAQFVLDIGDGVGSSGAEQKQLKLHLSTLKELIAYYTQNEMFQSKTEFEKLDFLIREVSKERIKNFSISTYTDINSLAILIDGSDVTTQSGKLSQESTFKKILTKLRVIYKKKKNPK